jgi:hypothetical protein
MYLIDKQGVIRHIHVGEGDYDGMERRIQELLREAGLGQSQGLRLGPESREFFADVLRGQSEIAEQHRREGRAPQTQGESPPSEEDMQELMGLIQN